MIQIQLSPGARSLKHIHVDRNTGSLPISLSCSVVSVLTDCRSQSTLCLRAPVPYQKEYMYRN